jgi:hypothetical protein
MGKPLYISVKQAKVICLLISILMLKSCQEPAPKEPDPKLLTAIFYEEGECLADFQYNDRRQVTEFSFYFLYYDESGYTLYRLIHLIYYYEEGVLYRINDFDTKDELVGYEIPEYDSNGTLKVVQHFTPSAMNDYQTDFYYDSIGRIRRIVSGNYGTPHRYSDFEYVGGNPVRQISFSDGYRDSVVTDFEYDNEVNPFSLLNLFYTDLYAGFKLPSELMSVNNMTRYTRKWITESYSDESVSYQYTYDDEGYPISCFGKGVQTTYYKYTNDKSN